MKRLKLYLETSIFGFLVGTRQDPYTVATERLFQEITEGRFDAFISDEVLRELRRSPEPLQGQLFRIISAHDLHELAVSQDARELSARYIEAGIVPAKVEPDALHIATATVNGLDILVSWNLQHIVKVKTRREVNAINALWGYKAIDLATPEEVIAS
jgi:hypothetical protein